MQQVLATYSAMFELPIGLSQTIGESDQSIPLIHGSHPPNVHPYIYPFSKNNEIENIIQELLVAGVICPSTRPYSSLVVSLKERR